jgi:hypothetical protein
MCLRSMGNHSSIDVKTRRHGELRVTKVITFQSKDSNQDDKLHQASLRLQIMAESLENALIRIEVTGKLLRQVH